MQTPSKPNKAAPIGTPKSPSEKLKDEAFTGPFFGLVADAMERQGEGKKGGIFGAPTPEYVREVDSARRLSLEAVEELERSSGQQNRTVQDLNNQLDGMRAQEQKLQKTILDLTDRANKAEEKAKLVDQLGGILKKVLNL